MNVERDYPERDPNPPWVHEDTPRPNQMLTINDICRRLDIDRTTVYGLISAGRLTATRIGSHLRVSETALASHSPARSLGLTSRRRASRASSTLQLRWRSSCARRAC